jgi:hypothetical protein
MAESQSRSAWSVLLIFQAPSYCGALFIRPRCHAMNAMTLSHGRRPSVADPLPGKVERIRAPCAGRACRTSITSPVRRRVRHTMLRTVVRSLRLKEAPCAWRLQLQSVWNSKSMSGLQPARCQSASETRRAHGAYRDAAIGNPAISNPSCAGRRGAEIRLRSAVGALC